MRWPFPGQLGTRLGPVPRLGNAFASMTKPVALVLDDAQTLHNLGKGRAIGAHLCCPGPFQAGPGGAGRGAALRTGRLRAEGRILEIGPADLSLTREEAADRCGKRAWCWGPMEVTELHRRTEGWPTGLYLAALWPAGRRLAAGRGGGPSAGTTGW